MTAPPVAHPSPPAPAGVAPDPAAGADAAEREAPSAQGRRQAMIAAGRAPLWRARLWRSPLWRDGGAALILGLATLALFWDAIALRLVAYENDTRIFYFPLF
ncbi:MAG: hypothetical protein M3442_03040, partial [Chloroflexota bacterium]|nr:hypothetical protein [Chloroflexota bacterium]